MGQHVGKRKEIQIPSLLGIEIEAEMGMSLLVTTAWESGLV